ncbi:MAG TPA: phosphotransferase [Steroidobacteraceae bacterium]|nr:phosphotransferase [Steroidobacteraceae bacterium]
MTRISPPGDARLADLKAWLTTDLRLEFSSVEPASADASFRRYFRLERAAGSLIVMDAPPGRENLQAYMQASAMLLDIGVNVPRVLEHDRARGFLLLTDLGTRLYLYELKTGRRVDPLYDDAFRALIHIQSRGGEHARKLPPYDRGRLDQEMQLLPDWFITRHLGFDLDAGIRSMLRAAFDFLLDEVLAQPTVFVHRDYHSRNLMVCEGANPGILDFQDAVCGAVAYDLVSLLRDLYVVWPPARVEAWVLAYRARAGAAGIDTGRSDAEFLRWFDLAGLQRHLKVLGIFARLWHRDGKPAYLDDLPATLAYVLEASSRYRELATLRDFLDRLARPRLAAATARAKGVAVPT